jgi:hypothetical protein
LIKLGFLFVPYAFLGAGDLARAQILLICSQSIQQAISVGNRATLSQERPAQAQGIWTPARTG